MYRSFQAPRLGELFFSALHEVVLGVGVGVGIGFLLVFYSLAYILMRTLLHIINHQKIIFYMKNLISSMITVGNA